ncbi:MAG: rhomboid family intramembrane serine protease [bacterium]|nr:rhomboid family intramembrane serine protease [bacterium]
MIIPIGDDNPREKVPYVTYSLIGINIIVYIYFGWIRGNYEEFVTQFGFIPAQFDFLTVFTSMFLHGDIFHLAGNMLYLWIYGDNVEAKFGKIRFLLFYLSSGVVAHGLQTAFSTNLQIPNIGASGAIAGVLGAYLVLFPRAKIIFWYFFIFYFRIYTGRFKVIAWLVLGFWFLQQIIFGYFGLSQTTAQEGGVAFFAHIGGFLCGVGVMLLFRQTYRFQRSRLLRPVIDEQLRYPVSYTSQQWKNIRNYQKTIKEVLIQQGTAVAVPLYEQMQSQYPNTALDSESMFLIAESYTRRREFDKALETYQKILRFEPHSEKADNALWAMAEIYLQHYHLPEKANQCLQIIVDGYPLSEWYEPAKQILEQEGITFVTHRGTQTVTRLGFAGRQLQFTGPVLIGLLCSAGTLSWMSASLPHRSGGLFIEKSAGTMMTETEPPVWLDNFDTNKLTRWKIKYPEDNLVRLSQDNAVSKPYSLRFSREQQPQQGLINPAEIVSETIPIEFTKPYTLSCAIYYTGMLLAQEIEFGHIKLEIQIIRLPVVGTSANVRYRFGTQYRSIQLKDKPFARYFPAEQWNRLELTVNQAQKTLTITINGNEWATVALDVANLDPKPKIRVSASLPAPTNNLSETTIVYLDDIAVYGKKIVEPKAETKQISPEPKFNAEFLEIYQLGWSQYKNGEYYSAITSFQKALALNPQSPEAVNALGLAYRQIGDVEKAREQFQLALILDPNFVPAKHNLETLPAETTK